MSDSFWAQGYSLPVSSIHGTPGKNAGVGSHSLFQGIFPIQGPKVGLLYCRQILYHLSHQGSQRKGLENTCCKFPWVVGKAQSEVM